MGNFLYKVRCALSRFMYGRNGTDQLGMAMLLVYVFVMLLQSVVALIFPNEVVAAIFSLIIFVLAVAIFYRIFSRNLEKRRAENRKFLSWWTPRQNAAVAARNRRRDKDHSYFKCSGCGAYCRVPKGKGRIEITCPRCHGTISGKS